VLGQTLARGFGISEARGAVDLSLENREKGRNNEMASILEFSIVIAAAIVVVLPSA
jgi:hypothetical protein